LKVIVDANVVLDVLLARKPFFHAATEIFGLIEKSEVGGFLCATTITTVDYLLTVSLRPPESRNTVCRLLEMFEIAAVNRVVIEEALRSKVQDFEDAVVVESGRLAGVEAVLTRNVKDFKHASLRVFDPIEFLASRH